MSHYTVFHFRAKLAFNLPEQTRLLLRNQFKSNQQAEQMHQALLRSEFGASAAAAATGPTTFMCNVGDPYPGPYYYNDDWIGHPTHPFFDLPRADIFPHGGLIGEHTPTPIFIEYPDGSSHVEFTSEINNGWDEIHEFLEWIKPYIRLKYGKRNRGRQKVWVGYWSSETMTGRVDLYVKACATPEHPTMLFGREVEEDYRNAHSY